MYGVLANSNDLVTNFKTNWYKMNKEHPNFGLKSGLGWENWWKSVISGTFKDSKYDIEEKKLDALSSHLIELYKTSTCWQQCYGAQDFLSYLTHHKVPLGVISNFDPRLPTTLSNTKLRHFFRFVLTSYEAGFEKPDPKIFEEAIKLADIKGLKPEECLHIGDTPLSDYIGAKSAGWNALLVHEKSLQELRNKYSDATFDDKEVFSSLYEIHRAFYKINEQSLL